MIKVEKLKFSYQNVAAPTLHDLDFEISAGEIFGFLGPSGAGKSTTQKVLFGLLKGYSGRVEVLGKEIRDWDSALYQQIGISFELPNHYANLSALENLEYFQTLYEDTEEPLTVLDWVGLKDDAEKRVSNFSKGMLVRLNVARSLLHKPKILFLDEPTSGLDPVNARKIMDLIVRLREEGSTVFITTHNMTVADELCDRVAFITNGRISNIDAPFELKKRYGKRRLEVQYQEEGQLQSAEFELDGLGTQKEFVQLINSGARIEAMHSQETTLEKIFIQLTGEELSDG